jgi:hypothetical protein
MLPSCPCTGRSFVLLKKLPIKTVKLYFMRGKYITTHIRMACLSSGRGTAKLVKAKKDIYTMLEETLAERKRIMAQLENMSRAAKVIDLYIRTKAA